MPQTFRRIKPLPGLSKLFLVQLYTLTIALFGSRLVMAAIGISNLKDEAVSWSLVFLALGLASIVAISGLHLRAKWAPGITAQVSLWTGVLFIAICVRVLTVLGDVYWYYSIGNVVMLSVVLSFFAMHVPIFFAWSQYFSLSSKVRAAFGLGGTGPNTLPPPGIGILRTLSAAYLVFFGTLIFTLIRTGNSDTIAKTIFFLALVCLPAMIMPVFFLFFSGAGRRQKPLLLCLAVFAGVLSCWFFAPNLIRTVLAQHNILDGDQFMLFARIISSFSTVPTPLPFMAFLLAILAWKLWSDPVEQAWFVDGQKTPREPEVFTFFHIMLLYYCCTTFCLLVLPLVMPNDNLGHSLYSQLFALGMSLCIGLNIAALCKTKFQKILRFLSYIMTMAIASLFMAHMFTSAHAAGDKELKIVTLLLTPSFYYLMPLLTSAMALLYWHNKYYRSESPTGYGFLSMPTPLTGFALFCIVLMVNQVCQKVSTIIAGLSQADKDYFMPLVGYTDPDSMLLGLEFWIANLVCPLLALLWLRSSLVRRKRFYSLCILWLICIFIYKIQYIIPAISKWDIAPFLEFELFDPIQQVYVYGIIFFMIYLACTKRQRGEMGADGERGGSETSSTRCLREEPEG